MCPVIPAAARFTIGTPCARPGIGFPRQEQKALHKVSAVSSLVAWERDCHERHAVTHVATAKLQAKQILFCLACRPTSKPGRSVMDASVVSPGWLHSR